MYPVIVEPFCPNNRSSRMFCCPHFVIRVNDLLSLMNHPVVAAVPSVPNLLYNYIVILRTIKVPIFSFGSSEVLGITAFAASRTSERYGLQLFLKTCQHRDIHAAMNVV